MRSRGAAAPPGWLATRITLQVALVAVGLFTALWLLYRTKGILFLLFLAILFGYVLGPLIELLRRPFRIHGRPRVLPLGAAISVAYLLLFGTVIAAVVLLLPILNDQIAEIMKRAPGDLARVQDQWKAWELGHTRMFPRDVRAAIDRGVQSSMASGEAYLKSRLLPRVYVGLAYLPWLLLVPILAFFFIRDAELFRRAFLEELSGRRLRRRGDALFDDISRALAAYIRAQILACAVVAAVCTAVFVLVRLPYAVILGVIAGLMEFIPLAGPLAIALVCVGVAALQSAGLAAGILLFLVLLRVVQDYIVYPQLVGREVRLHPLAVIVAILSGAELAGIAGIFTSVPVMTVLVVGYRHWKRHSREDGAARPEPAGRTA